jgi:hypothetical protein
MVQIGDKQRKYVLNGNTRVIPERITFNDPDVLYECNEEKTEHLLTHIKFTVKILDMFIPHEYCAISGTLLAAHRHQGMMLWDDDADFLLMKKSIFYLKSKFNEINAIDSNYMLVFIPLFGIKVFYKGHCYVDLIAFDFIDSKNKKIGYCSPSVTGKNMELCSILFPNEVYRHSDIFPVKQIPFEDFVINCPRNHVKILTTNYSPAALTEIVFPDTKQSMFHTTFFNKIEAVPFFYKACNMFEKYPSSTKLHNILFSFISYTMFNRYLSEQQKLLFAKCLKFDINHIGIIQEMIMFNSDFEMIQLVNTMLYCINNSSETDKIVLNMTY